MIQVVLGDGDERRDLGDAEVTLKWGDAEYTLADVRALILLDPNVGTQAGLFGGMPIMGLAFTDDRGTGLRIEIPMPLGFANDTGQQLVKQTDRFAAAVKLAAGDGGQALKKYAALPADMPPPPV